MCMKTIMPVLTKASEKNVIKKINIQEEHRRTYAFTHNSGVSPKMKRNSEVNKLIHDENVIKFNKSS